MAMTDLAEAAPTISAAIALVGIGIGVGKVLFDVAFLKREVTDIKTRLSELEKEQVEIKVILKQVAKKLKIGT